MHEYIKLAFLKGKQCYTEAQKCQERQAVSVIGIIPYFRRQGRYRSWETFFIIVKTYRENLQFECDN